MNAGDDFIFMKYLSHPFEKHVGRDSNSRWFYPRTTLFLRKSVFGNEAISETLCFQLLVPWRCLRSLWHFRSDVFVRSFPVLTALANRRLDYARRYSSRGYSGVFANLGSEKHRGTGNPNALLRGFLPRDDRRGKHVFGRDSRAFVQSDC